MKKMFTTVLCLVLTWRVLAQSEAEIHIYRPGQFTGSLTNFTIYLNDDPVCKLSNNKRITLKVAEGKYQIQAKESGATIGKKKIYMDLETKSGEIYFIRGDVKTSFTRLRMELTRVFPDRYNTDIDDKNIELDICQGN